jgi:VWFA-related protein
MRLLAVLPISALAVAAIGAQVPQTPAPDFRTEINYVSLPVRVLDRRGQFVRGLGSDDFAVFEDGKPQTIASFSAVDIPIAPASSIPNSARETLPTPPSSEPTEVEGRVYLFVVDDLLLSGESTLKLRNLMRKFIREKLGAGDVAAVLLTSGARGQPFTQDRKLLVDAVERVIGQFDPEFEGMSMTGMPHRVLSILAEQPRRLAAIQGRRKALVLISINPLCDGAARDCEMLSPILEDAARFDVTFYTIDPKGLSPPPRETAAWSAPRTGEAVAASGGYDNVGHAASAWRQSGWGPTSGSRILAEESGGFAVSRTNSFDAFFERLVRENSSYYLIGYYSTNTASDKKLRKHEVRVDRRGVRAVHRPGYFASGQAAF